jgi:hypothetical protein
MTTFSVAPQTVSDEAGGRLEFSVDQHDTGIVHLRVFHIGSEHPNDHQHVTFARNGGVISSRMVDAEVEEEARERAAAEARLTAKGVFKEASEEERKAAKEEEAKQIEADKALLASEPKVSKYEKKPEPSIEPEPQPQPKQRLAAQGVGRQGAGNLAQQGFNT